MTGEEYFRIMVDAQRAAMAALNSMEVVFGTTGQPPLATIMNEDVAKYAAERVERAMSATESDTDRTQKHILKYEDIVPERLRIDIRYKPIIIRALAIWLCNEAARLLRRSNVTDARKPGRKLGECNRDYERELKITHPDKGGEMVEWMLKDMVSQGLYHHVVNLKIAYLYQINNGRGPKYNDANTRDLIAWLYTIVAICEESNIYCINIINEINAMLEGTGMSFERPKNDFTDAFKEYPVEMLKKFGLNPSEKCDKVSVAIKVLRTQISLFNTKESLDIYNKSFNGKSKKKWKKVA